MHPRKHKEKHTKFIATTKQHRYNDDKNDKKKT